MQFKMKYSFYWLYDENPIRNLHVYEMSGKVIVTLFLWNWFHYISILTPNEYYSERKYHSKH